MGLLSGKIAAETERMKAVLAPTLTQTGDVKRPSLTSDGLGGQTETETTILTAEPLAIERLRDGDEKILGEKISGREPFVIHFAAGTAVQLTDRVYVGGIRYDVIAVPAPVGEEPMRPVITVKYS